MKEPKFKEGDKVTYKNFKDSPKGGYYYGGEDQDGFVGEIKSYLSYVPDEKCWDILVTIDEFDDAYCMLESEFMEYDEAPSNNELFPIY